MAFPTHRFFLLLAAALLVGIGGLACGGSEVATDEMVTDDQYGPIPSVDEAQGAIDEALQAFNEYCIAPRVQEQDESYPLTFFKPNPESPSFRYRQLQALESAGLLENTPTQNEGGTTVHEFALTEAGRNSQYDIARGRSYERRFCYAVPRVVGIDSIKSVYTSDPNPLANVWFAYTYRDLGQWAESAPIKRSFSGLSAPPSPGDTLRGAQLLIQVDSAWVDRRLTGYDRPPDRPSP